MENGVDASYSCLWPQIVFFSGKKLENQVFCDVVSNPKTTGFTRSISESITGKPDLMPTNINEWFFSAPSSEPCLWNAITLQSINLPLVEMPVYRIDHIFLTKPPNDRDCMILLFLADPLGILYYYASEDDGWTFRDYKEELIEFRGGRELGRAMFRFTIAFDDDKILTFSGSGVVAKIEIVKPKRLVIRHDHNFPHKWRPHVVGPNYKGSGHYVICCGDLFLIEVSKGGLDMKQIVSVDVSKLSFSNTSWKNVDSCSNAAFFIRGRQCLACPIASADSSKVGNRVYIVEEGRRLLHTYHILQKTLETSSIATPKHESISYWLLVCDAQVLAKAEDDYHNGGGEENNQLFVKGENKREMMVTHKHYKDEEIDLSTMLADIPVDILKVILSHLKNPSDYLNFRAICRSFRNEFSAKKWRIIKASESDSSVSPWLIYRVSQNVGKGVFYMVDPIAGNKYYVRTPETLEDDLRICSTYGGWLLMSNYCNIPGELDLFLYNPATKCTISLPKINIEVKHFFLRKSIVGISLRSHARPYCITISDEISDEDESDTYKYESKWKLRERLMMREHEAGSTFVQQSNVNAVFVSEVYYFLVGDGNIAYFSKDDDTLRIYSLEEPCSKSSYEQYFLAECDKKLLSIYIGKEWKWLRAFKFNKPEMVWDEVKDLEANNLYLSYVSSNTSKPQSAEVGNRIYFSRFYQDSIVYYSFNTQKFHISDGHDSVISGCDGSNEQMHSCWIEPSWKLEE